MANPAIIQATGRHTATVIFMHGLGDTGHGWSQMFQAFKSTHIKYICPHAPSMMVTLNRAVMPSWFDIEGLSRDATEDEAGIKRAAKLVHALIEEETRNNIPSNRIIIGGFSQGGALALYSAFTYPKPLAGVIALSCWMPLHKKINVNNVSVNRNAPIFQCHGDMDSVVLPEDGRRTAEILAALCPNHSMKWFSMDHSFSEEEVKELKRFIEINLPPTN